MRYAIYFTPSQDHPLTRAATRWLGRDAFSGETIAQETVGAMNGSELAFHTASPRRYGFHATLKAPFELAPGKTEAELIEALDAFCAETTPFSIPQIVARQLSGFFALVPEAPVESLQRFAENVVTAFDGFRAPMREEDIARRGADGLKPQELKYLHQWGYPYVFDAFRFHMTLSGRASGAEADRLRDAVAEHFADFVGKPLEIASIALFVEPEPGAPFTVRAFRRLGQEQQRKTA
ncbi:DUF1045 domain-containing protein [Mesorhizobium xinjiangense]|uniref:DUF1045 domain-containing protein n=1 Tax=Mesorhizobium xinjiangense TaxID=2678685 RepID=UPI0012EE152F|nr:DUF1045 domain-containing protein [Mesorhizobium xinjiangense]